MKATELRIGNLIEYRVEDEFDGIKEFWEDNVVDVYDLQHLIEYPETDCFRPKKITPDLLLLYGFSFDEEYNTYSIKQETLMNTRYDLISIYFPKRNKMPKESYSYIYARGWNHEYTIQHFHELQNLYFALKGVELTQVSEGENKNFV